MARETRSTEEEWFKKNERQLLEENRQQRDATVAARLAQEAEKEREGLKKLHWMKCPKCGHVMNATDIDGIEVDTCTLCEGIYFDRGELEQMLMRKQDKRFHFYRQLFGLD